MWLVLTAMRRPVTILVAVLAIAAGAWLAVDRMPVDIFPSLGAPAIYVAQPYGGMDPQQMEGLIANYYEYHFLYINNIRQVPYSWPSSQGAASTILTNDGFGNLTWSAPASGSLPQATLRSSNYSALTSDWLVSMDATAGVRTITLYSASGNSGRIIQTCKRDTSVNQVNVTDGTTTWNIFTSGTCIQFISDGSAWQIQSY